jgi:hypothetical protein
MPLAEEAGKGLTRVVDGWLPFQLATYRCRAAVPCARDDAAAYRARGAPPPTDPRGADWGKGALAEGPPHVEAQEVDLAPDGIIGSGAA